MTTRDNTKMSSYLEIVILLDKPAFHSTHGKMTKDTCDRMNVILSKYDKRIENFSGVSMRNYAHNSNVKVPFLSVKGVTKRCRVSMFSLSKDGGAAKFNPMEKSYGIRVEPYDDDPVHGNGLVLADKRLAVPAEVRWILEKVKEIDLHNGNMNGVFIPSISKAAIECLFDLSLVEFNETFYMKPRRPGSNDSILATGRKGFICFDVWEFPSTGSVGLDRVIMRYISGSYHSLPCYKRDFPQFETLLSIATLQST